jgi:hypothetical protein
MLIVFGQMMNDPATIKVVSAFRTFLITRVKIFDVYFKNLIGVMLSAIYISTFYFYTPINEKPGVWLKIGAAGAFSAALIGYTRVRNF